jgi:hypothetical protein
VFECRELRSICEPKRDEIIGDWTELRNKELYDLYSSRNIIRIIKSRSMRWARHAVRVGETRSAYKISVEKYERTRPLGTRRGTLKWILEKEDKGNGLDSSGSEERPVEGSC